MTTHMNKTIVTVAIFTISLLFAAGNLRAASLVGAWDFDGDFTATVGTDLTAGAGLGASGGGVYTFVNTTIGGNAAQVIRADTNWGGYASNHYLQASNPIGANGGGARTNEYTIAMDLFYPSSHSGAVLSMLESSGPGGTNEDVDAGAQSANSLHHYAENDPGAAAALADVWARVALVRSGTTASFYLDGSQVGSSWSVTVDNEGSLQTSNFWFLADNTTEAFPNPAMVNSYALFDMPLTAQELSDLGGASAAGIAADFGGAEVIPEPSAAALALFGLAAFATLGWRQRR